ncbi:MAG: hypothetical protein U0136_00785 [Bdellovibrionota bacterium]
MKNTFKASLPDKAASELRSEAGAVLVEWALVAGGLLLGVLVFRDTVVALNDYMVLSQLAHEGTRIASRVPALETGNFTNLDASASQQDKDDCTFAFSTAFQCGHYYVQSRLRSVLPLAGLSVDPAGVSLTTEYLPNTAVEGATDDTVSVTVTAPFRGFLLPTINIRSTSQGAYLFEKVV